MPGSGEKPNKRRSNLPPLPRPVQEHLAQKLRAQYHETGEKPKYLGDPMVPVAFDPLLDKIDKSERKRKADKVGEAGREAVATALRQPSENQVSDKPDSSLLVSSRQLSKHHE
jgi:hypothetical protein